MPRLIYILIFVLSAPFTQAQTADFSFQSTSPVLCNPSTIRFSQNCTGNPTGFVWDFGNNTKGYDPDVTVTYANAGTFTVKLIAIYDQTTVEISKTIVINPAVKASVLYNRNYICNPGIIQFSANSNAASPNYEWDFGDQSGPVITGLPDTSHNYSNFNSYQVSLKVTDTTGCIGITNTAIKVTRPVIVASSSPSSGCIPANTSFNATVAVPVNDVVTNYTWNFGDGSPAAVTTGNTVSHIYTRVGNYSPTLDIVTRDGCTNRFSFTPVTYGTPPVNHVAYPKKAIVCGSETPVFVSKATNANSYEWDFGDGTTQTVTDTFTRHKYTTLGIKTVTVIPYFNGCPGSTIRFTVEVVGVISGFTYQNSCADRKTYSFTNTSLGNISSSLWRFGDNSPNDATTNATHLFPSSGQFTSSLIVTDAITGCSDTSAQRLFTADPILQNPDSSICKNSNTTFTILNNYTSNAATFVWNVAGQVSGPVTRDTIDVKAIKLGSFTNYVIINYGSQSCPDTVYLNHSFLVKGPDLNFTAPASACFNTVFSVTNSSRPFIPADSVILWYWNYGNGPVNDTSYQPQPFIYKRSGTYTVKLFATDINGCKDSLAKQTIVASYPFLKLVPRIDSMCFGSPSVLKAFSSTNILWSPTSNISCSNCDSVFANPPSTTTYYVTATNSFNCSIRDSILVRVFTPVQANVSNNDTYICMNDKVQLDVTPKINHVNWTPVQGLTNTNNYSPIASPVKTTTYTATLTDSAGCFSSSDSVTIFVKTLPFVDAGPDITIGYNKSFTIRPSYSDNITNYLWNPFSMLACNSCPITTGIALGTETYTIKVTSDSGCVASDSITVFVECKNANILMPKAFTPNGDNLNDIYYPITRGIKTILKFVIYNRQGTIVYEAGNFIPNTKSFGWNGQYKGQVQPPAGYVYMIEALCDIGQRITQTGNFLLLR